MLFNVKLDNIQSGYICLAIMATSNNDIKYTYFDLRVRGESARLLLAYGGFKYEDCRVAPPWDDMDNWKALKPSMPWGQLPSLQWNGVTIFQSMTICRFLAREIGVAGRNNIEMAQVDEIIDVIKDAMEANVRMLINAVINLLYVSYSIMPGMLPTNGKCSQSGLRSMFPPSW